MRSPNSPNSRNGDLLYYLFTEVWRLSEGGTREVTIRELADANASRWVYTSIAKTIELLCAYGHIQLTRREQRGPVLVKLYLPVTPLEQWRREKLVERLKMLYNGDIATFMDDVEWLAGKLPTSNYLLNREGKAAKPYHITFAERMRRKRAKEEQEQAREKEAHNRITKAAVLAEVKKDEEGLMFIGHTRRTNNES